MDALAERGQIFGHVCGPGDLIKRALHPLGAFELRDVVSYRQP